MEFKHDYNSQTLDRKKPFYVKVYETLDKVRLLDIKIIVGYLNCNSGTNNTNLEHVMVKQGIGNQNVN